MIVKALFLLLILVTVLPVFGQTAGVGYWAGTMTRDGSSMDASFDFKLVDGKLIGFFNASSQRASGIPLDDLKANGDVLSFTLMTDPVTSFDCRISGENLTGSIVQEGFSRGTLSLKRAVPLASRFTSADVSYKSGNHAIAGRLYLPLGNGKHPAVVFLHGSGGEGMFANQYLAEYLAEKGIAALILDKQGVGRSTGNWMRASFEDLADDYVNAVKLVKADPRINPLQIGIYGHSQGGTISPLVASRSKDISFIIAAAAIGGPVYKQDLYRVANDLRSAGYDEADQKEAMRYYSAWLEMARTGKGFDALDSLNAEAKGKKWYDTVAAPPTDHWIWKYYLATGNYDSLDYWRLTKVPVLLVYGENDQIEDVKGYIRNIDNVLIEKAGNTDVSQLILPRAQHNLCIFPEKNEKFFWWHLSPGYESMIASWILFRFKN